MSSLVNEFIINPVLRQARRFSEISRTRTGRNRHPNPSSDSVAVAVTSNTEPPATRHTTDAPLVLPSTRPPSADTLLPTVEPEQPSAAVPPASAESAPMSNPTQLQKPAALPADDGMGALRKRLIAIQDQDTSPEEKARRMHEVLMERYRNSKVSTQQGDATTEPLPAGEAWQESQTMGTLESLKFWNHKVGEPSNHPENCGLTAEDVRPTYAPQKFSVRDEPAGETKFGCQHYMRNVKLQCSTCHKWYTCRFCHDAVEDHILVRNETKNMLCMACATPQKASDACVNCGVTAARYYCNVCKLWDDDVTKAIYHCDDCGICRKGQGLGKDFFHCKKCCACISISIQHSHKCIERSTDCDCPICGEYLFTSPKPVVFMPCGHSIHSKCYDEHMMRSYKCPICNKSLLNMESQFRQLELAIQSQPMPPEFRDTRATILCNDCSGKSSVPYHWLGLKCAICTSYNTVEVSISRGSRGRDGASSTLGALVQAPQRESILEGSPALPVGIGQFTSSGRRRHSSHAGPEVRLLTLDRLVRSGDQAGAPGSLPSYTHHPPPALQGVDEDENEMDILRLWRGSRDQDSEEEEEGSDSMSTDEDDEYEYDEDEDEDDSDDFMLIGHR